MKEKSTTIADLEGKVIVLRVSFGCGHAESAGIVRRVNRTNDVCWVGELCLNSNVKVTESRESPQDGFHWFALCFSGSQYD